MSKKKFTKLNCLLLTLTFIAVGVSGAQVTSGGETANQKSPKEAVHYCPLISELVKENLLWSARSGLWKSYSQSFAKEIDRFIGAQWIGVNVGKVICLYQGKGSFDFPIALEPAKAILILEPKGDTWRIERDGYKICKSINITDCPFFTKIEEGDVDVYENIKYKGQPGETNNDN
jgi:hypothetical protein